MEHRAFAEEFLDLVPYDWWSYANMLDEHIFHEVDNEDSAIMGRYDIGFQMEFIRDSGPADRHDVLDSRYLDLFIRCKSKKERSQMKRKAVAVAKLIMEEYKSGKCKLYGAGICLTLPYRINVICAETDSDEEAEQKYYFSSYIWFSFFSRESYAKRNEHHFAEIEWDMMHHLPNIGDKAIRPRYYITVQTPMFKGSGDVRFMGATIPKNTIGVTNRRKYKSIRKQMRCVMTRCPTAPVRLLKSVLEERKDTDLKGLKPEFASVGDGKRKIVAFKTVWNSGLPQVEIDPNYKIYEELGSW